MAFQEWMNLVETGGARLSPMVLDEAFPQGFPSVRAELRHRIRDAFEEWEEAVDSRDPDLQKLHDEWIRLVLGEGLELSEGYLASASNRADLAHRVEEHGVILRPDLELHGSDGKPLMLISVFPPRTTHDKVLGADPWAASPIERMTALCRGAKVPVGLVTDGECWTVVYSPTGAPSGHISWHARYWWQEPVTLQTFMGLLEIRRWLGPLEGRVDSLFASSLAAQDDITSTLGDQVRRAVEALVLAIDRVDQDRGGKLLKDVPPRELYEAALTVMMRLVFILCAEERKLLPSGDAVYDQYYGLSTLRARLIEESGRHGLEVLERRHDAWSRLLALCRAIFDGVTHETMRLPALGGSLFDPDRFPLLEGRPKGSAWSAVAADPLPIDNRTVLYLMSSLQVLERRGGAQLLSFKALDVEQIGHVYEGLLEHAVIRVDEVMLGLLGSKSMASPIVSLKELEERSAGGGDRFAEFFAEATGRAVGTVRNALSAVIDPELEGRLLQACGNDKKLAARIGPFAHLIRKDYRGELLIHRAGTVAIVGGRERRDTGTEYTPREKTQRIVALTLEPIAYEGPADGLPRDKWRLRAPQELLELKICDPAMGSGAVLVESCRWLGERIVESWSIVEAAGKAVTADGEVLESLKGAEPLPKDGEDRLRLARALVAERCLYGVDTNPMAVELAKLSLWLVTLAKDRPFGFLDHALHHGDSLLGITSIDQLTKLDLAPPKEGSQANLFANGIVEAVRQGQELRRALRMTKIREIADVREMARIHDRASAILGAPILVADALVGQALERAAAKGAAKTGSQSLALSAEAYIKTTGSRQVVVDEAKKGTLNTLATRGLKTDLPEGRLPRRPLHWVLVFPEVFSEGRGGFDAILGNPPYLKGKGISGAFGSAYRSFLVKYVADSTKGSADLVAYFFILAYRLLRSGGCFGLIATKTIAEGDTRQVGLERLLKDGAEIFAAFPDEPWPGQAAVVTSCVHIRKGTWRGNRVLSERRAPTISAFLSDRVEWTPHLLQASKGLAYIGSYVLGMGFTVTGEERDQLIAEDKRNSEVIFPYLTGDDLTSDPLQAPSRFVINFWDWPEASAQRFRAAYERIRKLVKPERQRLKRDGTFKLRSPLPEKWWVYADKRPSLYHAIGRGGHFQEHPIGWGPTAAPLTKVLVTSRVSKYMAFTWQPNDIVFSDRIVVWASADDHLAGLLSSSIHEAWVRKTAARMEFRLLYTPTDCFETFPLPVDLQKQPCLREAAMGYITLRQAIMQKDQIGLTELYNRFHRPSNSDARFHELRDIQKKVDECVLEAYGWSDMKLGHDLHEIPYLPENDRTRFAISESARVEILRRLVELNHVRFKEESKSGVRTAQRSKITLIDEVAD